MLNIAVCGKFHYPKYLKYLYHEDFLKNFYCSYKIGESFGIPAKKNNNFFSRNICTTCICVRLANVG